ncbi:transmembrane protein 145-like [Leptopilina boulardi]|uniref:transmembrane protein 145-like n=1 Tax=Leptopilina boulardi TaxID=63433 RepID=UPI0021F59BD8|nr:transmembrane protein 145-like [Leptopilina boulardi]
MFIRLTVFSLIFLKIMTSNSKILRGQLLTTENWAFLARFCFLSEKGRFQYQFILEEDTSVNLLLYYDSATQWPSVYPSNKTCLQKESVLNRDRGQVVPLTAEPFMTASSECIKNKTTKQYFCNSYREFKSSRPRWWFIALSDCKTQLGLNVTYWISLTNGPPGSFWREHFSADEFYILPLLIAFSIAYFILIILSVIVAIELRSRKLLHISYKLFMLSLWFYLLGLIFEIYEYSIRASLGVNFPGAALIASLFELCSETIFTVLLLLLSLGFTVTKSVLTLVQIGRLLGFIWISTILQLCLLIYQAEVFDPGLVLYSYESPPGYGLLALKIWTWIVFLLCCYKTSSKAATKLHFYSFLMTLGSVWFLFHPLMILIVTFLIDKWIRESVAKGCLMWIIFCGHALFLYTTRPAAANIHFPFHIRTFQVVPYSGNGQGHNYEPRIQNTAPAFTLTQLRPPNANGINNHS